MDLTLTRSVRGLGWVCSEFVVFGLKKYVCTMKRAERCAIRAYQRPAAL